MSNRLAGETSPYLSQHAENPVHWMPWGDEALALARREQKPILLSIGYSACHWCHVMAHESFEDAATAEVMNRLFVNVKVDREERPDLDHVYQAAQRMLTGRVGGWPLTMFLTPEGIPFFGGTYFPKTPRNNLPGFVELLEGVAEAWRSRRDEIEEQNTSVLQALAGSLPVASAGELPLDEAPIQSARAALAEHFDHRWGGFGGAPKFPQPTDLALLLSSGEMAHREMALQTLCHMAEGGLFDQLGGGFFRYCVDAEWSIPHFEKMLCDNGQLLGLYADAWSLTGDALFKGVIEKTATWALKEMRAPQGGFFTAQDADSEGEEGRYYVWTKGELGALLDPIEFAVFAGTYGMAAPPNFAGKYWHLHLAARLPEADVLETARAKVLAAREKRVRPGLDDKVLAGWNGLMIAGLLRAGRRLGRTDWVTSAQEALDFVQTALWRDGRLLATAKNGEARLNAYLDDHAFLLAAALESLQAFYRPQDMAFAKALADALLRRFEDGEQGGFFFTSSDHEQLVHRPKPMEDQATPAGNGAAAAALLQLAVLLGDDRYRSAAERTIGLGCQAISAAGGRCASLLKALDRFLNPPPLVVIRGNADDLASWQSDLDKRCLPADIFYLPEGLSGLPAAIDKPVKNEVNAWVCSGVNCLPPVESTEGLCEWFASHGKGL